MNMAQTLILSITAVSCTSPIGQPQLKAQVSAVTILSELEREYEDNLNRRRDIAALNEKLQFEAKVNELTRLIKAHIVSDVDYQAALTDAVLGERDDGFAHAVLQNLIHVLAERNSRSELIRLISRRCPKRLGLALGLEDCLVVIHKDNLEDGLLVLCEAYDKSEDPEVRRTIANVVRRGFGNLRIGSDVDSELMSDVKKWYLENRDAYVPNQRYPGHLSRDEFPEDAEGLFVEKGKAERMSVDKPTSRPIER